MSHLVIPDLEQTLLEQLQQRARRHGRTPEGEAKEILSQALHEPGRDSWSAVDAIHDRLAASDRTFSDSADLLREDRER
ncbi:MAG: FitA-like ribbon-helix-helix domain-containing protein [Planctomycetaceae bacterium]